MANILDMNIDQMCKLSPEERDTAGRAIEAATTRFRLQAGRLHMANFLEESHKDFGCSSNLHYATAVLRQEAAEAKKMRRIANLIADLPLVTEAAETGRLTWATLKIIAPVVTYDTEEHWLALAERYSAKELANLARQEKLAEDGQPEAPRTTELRILMGEDTTTLYTEATRSLCEEFGRRLDGEEILTALCFEHLTGSPNPDHTSRERYRRESARDTQAQQAREEHLFAQTQITPLNAFAGNLTAELTTAIRTKIKSDAGVYLGPDPSVAVDTNLSVNSHANKATAAASAMATNIANGSLPPTTISPAASRSTSSLWSTTLVDLAAVSSNDVASSMPFPASNISDRPSAAYAPQVDSDLPHTLAGAKCEIKAAKLITEPAAFSEFCDDRGKQPKAPMIRVPQKQFNGSHEQHHAEAPTNVQRTEKADVRRPHDEFDSEPFSNHWAAVSVIESPCPGQSGITLIRPGPSWQNQRLKYNPESRLLTPAQRREILRRDGYECATPDCPNHLWLHTHHITLYSEGGLTVPENMVTVCSACHRNIHDGNLHIERKTHRLRWTDRAGRSLRVFRRQPTPEWLEDVVPWQPKP